MRARRAIPTVLAAIVLVLLHVSPASAASREHEAEYRLLSNLRYGPHGVRNLADVYLPAEDDEAVAAPRPMLLLVHGGGWTQGDKGGMSYLADRYVRQGYVVVSINYRYAAGSDGHDLRPCHEDTLAAVRWMRRNAHRWNGNPRRVLGLGSSAGGTLVALAATHGTGPRTEGAKLLAAVTLSAPTRLWQDSASPVLHVDRSDAPTLVVHATREFVGIDSQRNFVRAMHAAGVRRTRALTIDSASHGSALLPVVQPQVDAYLLGFTTS